MARTSTIGLDIGSTAVRAAQLEFGSGGPGSTPPTLSAYAQLPLPAGVMQDGVVVEPDKVASAVKALWQVGKFSAHDVVMGVGNQHVIVREADLAWQPMNVLKKSLPYQAQDLLPVASGDAVFDFVPTGEFESEEGRRMSGLLVAAIRDMVSANVRAAEAGGVRPLMVDLNPLAIQRAQTQGELKNTLQLLLMWVLGSPMLSLLNVGYRGSCACYRMEARSVLTHSRIRCRQQLRTQNV